MGAEPCPTFCAPRIAKGSWIQPWDSLLFGTAQNHRQGSEALGEGSHDLVRHIPRQRFRTLAEAPHYLRAPLMFISWDKHVCLACESWVNAGRTQGDYQSCRACPWHVHTCVFTNLCILDPTERNLLYYCHQGYCHASSLLSLTQCPREMPRVQKPIFTTFLEHWLTGLIVCCLWLNSSWKQVIPYQSWRERELKMPLNFKHMQKSWHVSCLSG